MSKTKIIKFDAEARVQLLEGIDILTNAVKATLGPNGRNVILQKPYGNPQSTKDGVSVAKEITLSDPIQNLGAQMVKEVAASTAVAAGDGTTTATILARNIFASGLKNVAAGANPIEIKRGIDIAVSEVVEYIRQRSIPVNDISKIRQIATVSANNDAKIGQLIATAMEKVGHDGIVFVEEGKSADDELEVVEGLQFKQGYVSPFMATNTQTLSANMDDVFILIYDKKITAAKDILPLLEWAATNAKQLLIIAEDVDGEALATMVVNKSRGMLKVCAVKAPGFGENRTAVLEDIATITGGELITAQKGLTLAKIDVNKHLGRAKSVIVTKNDCTIVDGQGDVEMITARINDLKVQLDATDSTYEKDKLNDRIARMLGGIAVISVGANSELELKEKKDRVDDALHATKAAVAEGIVPGGGTMLLQAAQTLTRTATDPEFTHRDQFIGYGILREALYTPLKTIVENGGVSGEVVKANLLGHDLEYGYDARNCKYVNMIEQGIIDPAKVTRTALENAASVAGVLLTTEAVIAVDPESDKANNAAQDMLGQYM